MYVSKEAIERIRRSHDLVAVVQSHGVKLARRGRHWVGLCPFHADREPSLVVNPDKQLWNCLGACRGAGGRSGGDVFTFVAKAEGVSFPEALKRLGYTEPAAQPPQVAAAAQPPQVAAAAQPPSQPPAPTRGRGLVSRPAPARPVPAAPSAAASPAAAASQGAGPVLPPRRDLLERVVEHYHRAFRERAEGQDYLRERGLEDAGMLAAFHVGYADGSLRAAVGVEHAAALEGLGVLNGRGRELLGGCVVFPLSLPEEGVVGLYGRHVRHRRHLYLPGPRRGVFHWQALKASAELILAESVLDALTLYQAGWRNVSCIYGTQGLTADHEELLARFRVRRVLLCLDNDDAGEQATAAVGERLRKLGIDVADIRVTDACVTDARVSSAKDPNELFASLGVAAARAALSERITAARPAASTVKGKKSVGREAEAVAAPPSLPQATSPPAATPAASPSPAPSAPAAAQHEAPGEGSAGRSASPPAGPAGTRPEVSREKGGGWLVGFAERTYRVRGLTATGLDRLRVNLRIEQGHQVHLDTLDLYSHRARAALARELAALCGREEAAITAELAGLIDTLEGLRLELAKESKQVETSAAGRIEVPASEKEAAMRLLRAPDLVERLAGDFEHMGCVGERTGLLAGYLATVSRLLDDPLSLMVVSRSGAGKSRLQEALCAVVPEEALVRTTRLTGQALFYMEEDALAHKVLAIDEEEGAAAAAYSIRNLASAQVLSVAATRTDPATGKLRTDEYRVRGPVSILLTTTSPEALDYETRSRFVQVGVDESEEQTRRILARQRQADTLEGVLGRAEAGFLTRLHQNAQRLLVPLQVVNPYAPKLRYPDRLLQMRREQKKYLTLIKAIALLHQHQREVKRARRGEVEVAYIEVAPSDVTLANELARQVLGRCLDELAHPTRQLLKHLVEMCHRRRGRPSSAATGGSLRNAPAQPAGADSPPPEKGGRGPACGSGACGTFTRQEVREVTGWTDWQVRVHLRQLLELEYVVVAAGGAGRRLAYELLFDGDPDEETRYLSGLVEVPEPSACETARHLVRQKGTLREPCEPSSHGASHLSSSL